MMSKMNGEVGPRVSQHAKNMASRLSDLTRINPPLLFRSKSDDDTHDIFDGVYTILLIWV